jgi:membrane protein
MPLNNERAISDVLQDIFANLQEVVRSELRLAKVEIQTEAAKAAKAGKLLAGGAVLFLYAGGLLLLAGVYALSMVLQPWLAAAVVGALLAVVAAILFSAARRRLQVLASAGEND